MLVATVAKEAEAVSRLAGKQPLRPWPQRGGHPRPVLSNVGVPWGSCCYRPSYAGPLPIPASLLSARFLSLSPFLYLRVAAVAVAAAAWSWDRTEQLQQADDV